MILVLALLVVLICTATGSLLHLAGLGFLAGVLLAAYFVWAQSPTRT